MPLLLFSRSVVCDSLQPHGLQHARLPCPSLSPRVCSNSCPCLWVCSNSWCVCQWCYTTISFFFVPFSFCPQSFPASGCFPMTQFFGSGGRSIGVSVSASASVLPMNIQSRFPSGLIGLISLLSKGLSIIFSNTTVQKHLFVGEKAVNLVRL